MKLLKGLNETIKGYDGKELLDQDNKLIIIKNILANSLALARSSEPARMLTIGLGIHNCKGEFELEDADFTALKKAVDEIQLTNVIKVPILEVLEKVEEVKKEDSPKN